MTRVVIVGVSTRAAAASAARAGYDVTAIDAYADRDQQPGVRAVALPGDFGAPFTAAAAAAAAATVEADAAVYLSNLENDVDAVATLSAGRALWGNPPEVLRRARDPLVVASTFRAHGLPVPDVRHVSKNSNNSNLRSVPDDPNASHPWLAKPLCSGGGHGIRAWTPGRRVPSTHYLQQRVDGTPGSIVFVAAAGRTVTLGLTHQLIGDPAFGAGGYRYCGSILAPTGIRQFVSDPELVSRAVRLADIAAADLGLVGVNGIDFIGSGGIPYPIEINPRWTASMELIERARDVNVFAAHAAACTAQQLPSVAVAPARAVGKAIVFARDAAIIGDTDEWLADADVRDVPHRGESIAAGSPVCTVFADAPDTAACYTRLVACAGRIYDDLDRWRARARGSIHDSRVTAHE